ncbi:acyl-ACP desaturase [Streptomyces sp. NPDC085931]|uniref:acyl-ACP desaturase n=1 Tax=Streptomyces sp. NPDC085931 TaxID=3365740 RepID=UPI0037D45FE5
MTGLTDNAKILLDLEPVAADALDAHLANSTDWYPHQYIPWSQGLDYEGVINGRPWEAADQRLNAASRDGLLYSLLAEENLPSYHRVIANGFSIDGAWGTWVHRWTVEESRHSTALRDYLIVTRAIDPVVLEDNRAAHVQHGYEADYDGDVLASLVYVTLQELGTRVAYQGIRRLCNEPACDALLNRIAHDENCHMLFYRAVLQAAMRIDPDRTLQGIAKVMANFRPPGHAIPGYARFATSMARSGIYSPSIHHDHVLVPLTRTLRALDTTGLTGTGRQAQERIAVLLDASAHRARRYAELSADIRSSTT